MSIHTSVIVLTYRRVPALLAVLRGLAHQVGQGVEILIADDGSPDSDVQAMTSGLPTLACPVWHVWHPDTGFTASRARNLAAARAQGRYLVFLDGDCVPGPNFLQHHIALQRPGQFVNGSRVLLSQALTRRVEQGEVEVANAGWPRHLAWRLSGDSNKWSQALPFRIRANGVWRDFRWKGIRSCNFALWRQDFERVNGFDESFEGWGHEDADLVLRLHHADLSRCNSHHGTEVYHLWHPDNARNLAEQNRQTVLGRMRSPVMEAKVGLRQSQVMPGVVVTRLC